MHHDDIDQIINALDAIVRAVGWAWDNVQSINDALRISETLVKLAKPIIELIQRHRLPRTQTISLPTIISTPVLFAVTVYAESHCTARLTTGAPNC
jgi:hypothetical protein